MNSTLALPLILSIGLSALVQFCTDPRVTGKFVRKSLVALAVYFAHAAVGAFAIFFLVPHGPSAAPGVAFAFLGWVGLDMLSLIRFAPRLRTPPAVLLRFGFADVACLLTIGAGLSGAVGWMP